MEIEGGKREAVGQKQQGNSNASLGQRRWAQRGLRIMALDSPLNTS